MQFKSIHSMQFNQTNRMQFKPRHSMQFNQRYSIQIKTRHSTKLYNHLIRKIKAIEYKQ